MTVAFESFSKATRFADLVQSAQHCDLCPRLCSRRKVLSPANGSIESKVLFIAEAPGRLGADRTGVPLCGDRTGDNFEMLLGNVGWRREQVFITNAILCNPQDGNGNNGTPTPEEVGNCSAYVEMVINLVRPEVVVTLGATALDALAVIAPHGLQLREDAAKVVPWGAAKLVPLYHPGPRAIIHRSLAKQRSDFMRLAQLVHPVSGILQREKRRVGKVPLFAAGATPMQQIAYDLLDFWRRFNEPGYRPTWPCGIRLLTRCASWQASAVPIFRSSRSPVLHRLKPRLRSWLLKRQVFRE